MAKKAELKTKKNEASVEDFIGAIKEEALREDCLEIAKLMKQVTKSDGKMWGSSIIGFGEQHLIYASGRELDWMLMGFSPRKQNITLYLPGALESYKGLLDNLGKHTTGKGCLYIKKLADVDKKVLKELVSTSAKNAQKVKHV
ncbi:MAG: DUF1801 domain-containing protein [Anaerolineales bacterium]|jgi:hypothetical protein|uniref:DUF1801 domain-containing protein n=1 Tax=Candidatus Villigracilis vicinus TaxID=3140679 RepID=UPI003137209F|nr:DUF1801 domain-containing protein [Anaerolineales bacterium]MBK7450858.1 DUF1801 domain-containing protein [Anaerolineales bacterium]